MRKILVPTDFSEEARNAFEVALAIARKTGAAIKLLHVVEVPHTANFSATGDVMVGNNMDQLYTVQLLEITKMQMGRLLEAVDHKGVEVEQEVETGLIISNIKRTVQDEQVDLVVMGSKGASGLDEFLIGSNTEKVVRAADCPVLTVKHRQPAFEVREVVLASDFKREIGAAIEKFKYFQEMFGARLHLLYVNTPGAFESSSILHRRLQEIADKYGLRNYTINTYNDTNEEDGILHFAQDIKADLIMMATHGRTGLAHLLSGSIAEDLVNHTHKPVLTIHLK
ncbi:universal stress protein [Pontibacter sp. 172403-2]|uniref:universal stress protein n=1 Tax=Pontibacter rufus TaxID=2791028 RepID=UPI0018B00CBD|nr:universal stress protein [Pontibacter sp. 172403-2]MBF9254623.1 universal stress protein [Pontibacter sp. 172403-2]